ncbi:MAG: DNA polymerase III subunit beta [Chloroflexota bacterium]|nr:DNA polymerase III subunit beta [Chloroflexota bacterium]
MRVSVLQDQLAKALSMVSRAVESRSNLPVLQNIMLSTEDSQLRLAATNLEMAITTTIGAKVEQAGQITLPAKTLVELVNNLSPERVDLTLDPATQSVNVRCGTTNSNVRGISATEFPVMPKPGNPDAVLPARLFKSMIREVEFSTASEDSRPILTGIYTHFDNDMLTLATADGYRLAVRTAKMDTPFESARELVIPAKSMRELGRILPDDDSPLSISLPENRNLVIFQIGNSVISSQLLEGKFPDFSAIIPKSYNMSLNVAASELLRACKRAEIFARDSNYSARLAIKPPKSPGERGEIVLVGRSAERGDNEGVIDANIEGEGMEVAFNIKYLIDMLTALGDSGDIVLESNGAAYPGVLRPGERNDYIYVVMPMSLAR